MATFTVVIAMSVGLICVLLIPIDIFITTSKDVQKLTDLKLDTNYFKAILLGRIILIKLYMDVHL